MSKPFLSDCHGSYCICPVYKYRHVSGPIQCLKCRTLSEFLSELQEPNWHGDFEYCIMLCSKYFPKIVMFVLWFLEILEKKHIISRTYSTMVFYLTMLKRHNSKYSCRILFMSIVCYKQTMSIAS
jgi:hypothetical protein